MMLFANIVLLGVELQEPGTIISDLIMGIFCFIFFAKLLNRKEFNDQKYFSQFFLFLGLSSIIAAFAHGLYQYFGLYLHKVSWILSGLSIYFLQLGSSVLFKNEKFKTRYLFFIKTQLLLYIVLLFFFDGFLIVKLNFVLGLLCILTPVYLIDMLKNKLKHNMFIVIGVLLAIIPSVFHRVEFNFLYIFNMNDLSHFFLIICIFFVFLGLNERFYKSSTNIR